MRNSHHYSTSWSGLNVHCFTSVSAARWSMCNLFPTHFFPNTLFIRQGLFLIQSLCNSQCIQIVTVDIRVSNESFYKQCVNASMLNDFLLCTTCLCTTVCLISLYKNIRTKNCVIITSTMWEHNWTSSQAPLISHITASLLLGKSPLERMAGSQQSVMTSYISHNPQRYFDKKFVNFYFLSNTEPKTK